jgi:hypothetical protein
MMQPSDLDRKIPSPLPSHITKSNRVPAPKNNPLGAVSANQSHPEMSAKDIYQEDNINHDPVRDHDIDNSSEKISTDICDQDGNLNNSKIDDIHHKIQNLQPIPELAATPNQGFLPVLKNSNFLALWGGQVFCQLADKVYLVLMIALINTQLQTGDSSIGGWVSALMMAFTIPAVLFGSLAGVFGDTPFTVVYR